MSQAQEIKPVATAQRTEAQISDPGITYNEAGVSYNEAGITYGGIYGNQDMRLIIASAREIKP